MEKGLVQVEINEKMIADVEEAVYKSALATMRQILTDLISSQTIPFDTGTLQESHFVDSFHTRVGEAVGAVAYIATGADVPYARYIYYHPEFHFQTVNNPNAQALWYETYVNGEKAGMIEELYSQILQQQIAKITGKG